MIVEDFLRKSENLMNTNIEIVVFFLKKAIFLNEEYAKIVKTWLKYIEFVWIRYNWQI